MLQDDAQLFRTLVENAADLLWVADLDLRFSYVSPAVLHLTGFSAEEMLARTVEQNLTPASLRLVLERSAEAREAKKEEWQEEVEFVRKDGSTVWTEVRVKLLRDPDGRPFGFLGATRDVSRRKAAKETLRHRLELETLVADISSCLAGAPSDMLEPTIVTALEMLGQRTGVEHAYLRLLGDDRDAFVAKYDWFGPVAVRPPERPMADSLRPFTWASTRLRSGQTIYVPSVAQLVNEAPAEHTYFQRAGMKSVLAVPLMASVAGELLGFMGVDAQVRERAWSDEAIALLKVIGEAMLGAVLRARAQQTLQEREAVLRQLIDTSPSGILLIDSNGRISEWNQGQVQITGLERSEVIGRPILDVALQLDLGEFITDADYQFLTNILGVGLSTGQMLASPYFRQYTFRQPGGSLRTVDATGFVIRAPDGTSIGAVVHDVTEQAALLAENTRLLATLRKAHDDLERLVEERTAALVALTADLQRQIAQCAEVERSLRASEARNQALLSAIPDSIWVITREGFVVDSYVNASHEGQVLGCPGVMGRHVRELMPPDSAQRFLDLVHMALDSGQLQVLEFTMPLSPTNTARYEARLVATGDQRVLCIARDITLHKALTDSLLRAERLAALGQFAAALAHEINNPLQIVQNYLELVVGFPLSAEERRGYLATAIEEVQRLSRVTTDVLDMAYSRSADQAELDDLSSKADVAEVVGRVLLLTGRRLRQDGIQVISDLPPAPPARIAPSHLTQIGLNLVMNAADALQGFQDGILEIKLQVANDKLRLVFANNGPPFDAESLPRLFEPFFSTKPAGRGLGLWVCRILVQRCGGHIVAANLAPDRGVAFEISLPVGS